ncbi:hypothetical protein N7461_007507 [Penicillium sp. DV-2018c]|nr:hypothetical protein N7461_007507 [Penicillium sp. DV-2018c]
MATQTETYTTLPSDRQSKMKIDALLNSTDSPSHQTTTTTTSTTTHHSIPQQPLPSLPPSPGNYWYSSPGIQTQTLPIHSLNQHQDGLFVTYHRTQPNHSTKVNLSAPCSPEPYRTQRFSSVSSNLSNSSAEASDRRRPPRPKYEEEEMYFIWYHRVDLCQEWKEVREAFNRQFSARQRRGFQGIQCKFYRFIKEKKCPTLREQRRMRDGEFLRERGAASLSDHSRGPKFGVRQYSNVWYPWMRKEVDLPRRGKM